MFNNVGHVRPASPINTKCEFSHVMRPHYRVTHIGRQNGLNEPVINTAGHEGGMGYCVHKGFTKRKSPWSQAEVRRRKMRRVSTGQTEGLVGKVGKEIGGGQRDAV